LHNAHNYWCWPCSVANRIPGKGRDVEKRRIHDRRYRERARRAPGLSQYGIHALLATWKQQRRACTYCPSLATSVDHVIPLALGGTNYEGNLTPACGPCNRRKNDDLLIVWRRKLSEAVA
jgi:5-methylcytosine-specific restriction endonuclease McrA